MQKQLYAQEQSILTQKQSVLTVLTVLTQSVQKQTQSALALTQTQAKTQNHKLQQKLPQDIPYYSQNRDSNQMFQSSQIQQQSSVSKNKQTEILTTILKKYVDYQFQKQMDLYLIKKIVISKKDFQEKQLITDIAQLLKNLQTFVIKRCSNLNNSLNFLISIKSMQNLKIINLISNDFIKLVQLFQLKSLKIINLNNCCNLFHIKIKQCPQVVKLDLIKTNITQQIVYQIFNQLPELQQLNISLCPLILQLKLKGIVQQKNSKLRKINLSQTLVKQLQLSSFNKLIQINTDRCKSLASVKITECKQFKFINQILQAKSLEELQLIELPSLVKVVKINQNKKLNKVTIKYCQVISKIIIYHTTIKELNLYDLPNLKSLNLSESTFLKDISIKKCQNIESLILQLTPINKQQLQEFQNQFQNLKYLNLHSCRKIDFFDFNIERFNKKLTKLNLCYTKITESDVNYNIKCLKQLQYLNIMNCSQLKMISFYQMPNLKTLHLDSIYVCNIYLQNLGITSVELLNCRSLYQIKVKNCQQLTRFIMDCIFAKFYISQIPALQVLKIKNYRKGAQDIRINLGNTLQSKLSSVELDSSQVQNVIINCQFNSQILSQLSINQYQKIKKFIIKNGKANIKKLNLTKSWIQQINLYKKENISNQIQFQQIKNQKMQEKQQQKKSEKVLYPQCLFEFKNLQIYPFKYDFRGNRITFKKLLINVYDHIFTNLKQLNLSENSIKNIQVIQLIPNQSLQALYLNENQIIIFKSLKKVKKTTLNIQIHQKYFHSNDNLSRFINLKYKQNYDHQEGFIFGKEELFYSENSDQNKMKITVMNYLTDGKYLSLCFTKHQMLKKMKIQSVREKQIMYQHLWQRTFNQKSYFII